MKMNAYFTKGKEDALAGLNAVHFGDLKIDRDYICGYFKGMLETDPAAKNIDETAFREGYLSVLYPECLSKQLEQNPSFVGGRMFADLTLFLEKSSLG